MQRSMLAPHYTISKIIKGGWQLAGGHGVVNSDQAVDDMFAYFDAGITTFDCADIYTGVESLIGQFLRRLRTERGMAALSRVQVHTKYVPDRQDLGTLTNNDVERAIRRSINRLGVERLDVVQFHWWDFEVRHYVAVAMMLAELQRAGLIRHIGLTNFDAMHIQELLDAGVQIQSNQVQYSILDRRAEKNLQAFCADAGIALLCYGSLAGGLISETYLNRTEPTARELQSNRSLIKYKLIIDDIGGWAVFQKLLKALADIGSRNNLTISQVALLYVLQKPRVGAVIVGARNSNHIPSLITALEHRLPDAQMAEIEKITGGSALKGDIYELERTDQKHASIMKYNLHKEKP